jgi:DtxR family transcriptional regulator, Mn-dependent transcriptional regulator
MLRTMASTGNARTAATQEYLAALRNLVASNQKATVATLARRLNVSPQAVSEMIGRLRSEGLVDASDSRELNLTTSGRAVADAIFRRHALVEWLLTGVVGMGWAESDREAHHLQGAISENVEMRLAELLGNPETCPHGNPIDVAAANRRPAGVPLSSLASGDRATIYRITEEAEEDAGLLSYLEARGLRPGAEISVLASSASLDAITVEGPRGSATFGLHPARLILVLPGTVDPNLFHKLPASRLSGSPT